MFAPATRNAIRTPARPSPAIMRRRRGLRIAFERLLCAAPRPAAGPPPTKIRSSSQWQVMPTANASRSGAVSAARSPVRRLNQPHGSAPTALSLNHSLHQRCLRSSPTEPDVACPEKGSCRVAQQAKAMIIDELLPCRRRTDQESVFQVLRDVARLPRQRCKPQCRRSGSPRADGSR